MLPLNRTYTGPLCICLAVNLIAPFDCVVYNRDVGYKTLYRKYRSQTFSEVVGQEHVIRVLLGALSRDRIAHAYLFSGPRGTGKTSIARIFAKALNCPEAKAGEPCGKCHVCVSIAEGRSPDVIEMDAASNRGVENIEELRRGVQFVPQEFKYKVYIIDEVHMISTHGFNALLKTLEEPPSHAIFVLATTEPHKLPITILSRCLRFEFHRIPFRKLADHLLKLSELENQKLRDDAAMLLAELADGSARDAISLLDQLIIAGEEEITPTLVRELFGLTHPAALTDLVRNLLSGNLPKLLESFKSFVSEGRDPENFLKLLYLKLRDGYLKTGNDDELLLMLEATESKALLQAIEIVWDALVLLSRSNHPVNLIELTLFKLAASFASPNRDIEFEEEDGDGPQILTQSESKKSFVEEPVKRDSIPQPPSPPIAQDPANDNFDPMSLITGPKSEDKTATSNVPNSISPESLQKTDKTSRPFENNPEGAQKKTVNLGVPNTPPLPDDVAVTPSADPEWDSYAGIDGDMPPTFSDSAFMDDSPETKAKKPDEKIKAEKPSKKSAKRKLPEGFGEFPEDKWEQILDRIEANYLTTFCLVNEESGVIPVVLRPHVLYLIFPADALYLRSFAREGRHKRAIEQITEEVMEGKWKIVFDPGEDLDTSLTDEEIATLRTAQLEMLFGGKDDS